MAALPLVLSLLASCTGSADQQADRQPGADAQVRSDLRTVSDTPRSGDVASDSRRDHSDAPDGSDLPEAADGGENVPQDWGKLADCGLCLDPSWAIDPSKSYVECAAGEVCVTGICLEPGQECDDGNDIPWDGCTIGRRSEFLVSGASPANQWEPSVAALADGGYVVAWTGWAYPELPSGYPDGDAGGVLARVFDEHDSPVTEEFLVNSSTASIQQHPAVVGMPDGSFVALWDGPDAEWPGSAGLFLQRFAAYSYEPLGAEMHVEVESTFDGVSSRICAVALDADRLVVAWSAGPDDYPCPSGGEIHVALLSPGMGIQAHEVLSPFDCLTPIYDRSSSPAVSLTGEGEFLLSWFVGPVSRSVCGPPDEAPVGLFAQFRHTEDVTGASSVIPLVTSEPSCEGTTAVLPDGSIVAAAWWKNYENQLEGIPESVVQRFSATGEAIGTPLVAGPSVEALLWESIAVLPDGGYVVIGSRIPDECQGGVFAQIFDAQGSPGKLLQLSTNVLAGHWMAKAATLANGDVLVAWMQGGIVGCPGADGPSADECGTRGYARRIRADELQ